MLRAISLSMTIVFAGLIPLSAAEADSDAEQLAKGLKTWETSKEKCAGNYTYTVSFFSAFGFGTVTEIDVQNNKVTGRRFKEVTPPKLVQPGEKPAEAWKWRESGEKVGTHKQGAPAKTLDELYKSAKEIAAKELAAHDRRYVRLDKQGLPVSCFIIDTRIADDAPRRGLAVSSIKLAMSKGATSEPIKKLRIAAKQAVFKEAGRDKPLKITTARTAAKYFGEKELAELQKSVDFDKQIVLVFAWRGSGRDRLSYDVAESSPEQVTFKYTAGFTRDLRPHQHVYVLRSNVKWSWKKSR